MKITKKQLQQIIKEELQKEVTYLSPKEQALKKRYAGVERPVATGVGSLMTPYREELLAALAGEGMTMNKDHEKSVTDDQLLNLLKIMIGPNYEPKAPGASDINEAVLADRAAGRLKQLLTQKPVRVILNRMKTVLDSQGKPGSPGRKEEIAALLGPLGITVADLIKIVSGMKGEEKNQPEQSSDMSL